MTDHWSEVGEPCRLGYEEYDGARYCFAHGGFLEPGIQSQRCDRAGATPEMDLPGMWSQSDFLGGSGAHDGGVA